MILIRIWIHIKACIEKAFYKLIYGKRLHIGKRVCWRKGFTLMKAPEAVVDIGDNCYFNNYCTVDANARITIGEGALIGENVKIYDHNYRFNTDKPIKEQGFSNGEVYIGNHCWIGNSAVILKGAHISDHCVIGAGCVVSDFVPEWSILTQTRENKIVPIIRK